MKHKNIFFVTIVLLSSLGQIISDIYLPSLVSIGSHLHTSVQSVQLSLTFFMVGFAVSQLFYGPVSDGVGRKIPLLTGLSICIFGTLLCIFASNINVLIVGRLFQGIGIGAGASLFRPMLRDVFSGGQLAEYASYSALIGVGFLATSPLLGGYIQHYFGWRAIFVFILIFLLVTMFSCCFLVPETSKYHKAENLRLKTIINNSKMVLTNKTFFVYNSCSILTYAAIFSWVTAGPIYLQKTLGVTPVGIGWIYALTGAGFALGAFLNAKIGKHKELNSMIRFGLSCFIVSAFILLGTYIFGATSLSIIVFAMVLALFGTPFIFPNTFAGAFQPFPEVAGVVGALFGSMRIMGGALASFIISFTNHSSQLPVAIMFLCCASLSWYLLKKLTLPL